MGSAVQEQNGATPGQIDIEGQETPAPPEPPVERIVVEGSTGLQLKLGGKMPQTAVLRLSVPAMHVDGAFKKGDRISGSFDAVIVEVGQVDKRDKQTGMVVEAVQKHTAVVTDLALGDPEA